MTATSPSQLQIESIITDILGTIDREREREIIARRYGLFDRKETLEQIGELLGITRERVRQLEKAVMARLKAMADAGQLPHIQEVQTVLLDEVRAMGKAARISDLSARLTKDNSRIDQARVSFCPPSAQRLPSLMRTIIFITRSALPTSMTRKRSKISPPEPSRLSRILVSLPLSIR